MAEPVLKLALFMLAAKARGTLLLLLLAYISLAAMLLYDDPWSGWTWAGIIGGGLVVLLGAGLVWFWLAVFRGFGGRRG